MKTGDLALSVAFIALGLAIVALLHETDKVRAPLQVDQHSSGQWDFNSASQVCVTTPDPSDDNQIDTETIA